MAARGVVAPHRVFKLVCFLLLMLQKRKAVEAGVAAASKRVTSKAKGNGMAGAAGAEKAAENCWGSSDPDLVRCVSCSKWLVEVVCEDGAGERACVRVCVRA